MPRPSVPNHMTKSVVTVLTLFVALYQLPSAGSQQFRPQPPPYRILVSNDDGVNAPGIAAVAQILQAIGDVIIVAPAVNQSGAGHSIVTSQPIFREDVTLPNGLKAIGLTATPASTVNVAIRNIVRPRPDLVVSGINSVYNLGYSGYLSGTVGAAREAAIHGVPAIAASLAEAAPRSEVHQRRRRGARGRASREAVRPAAEYVSQRERSAQTGGRIQGLPGHNAGDATRGRRELPGDQASIGAHGLLERVQGRWRRAAGNGYLGGGEWVGLGHADEVG